MQELYILSVIPWIKKELFSMSENFPGEGSLTKCQRS